MIHDQYVYHKWHVFVFFISCPESSMDISGVGSFPVWSGFSLKITSSFSCRKLALNGETSCIHI